MGSAWVRAVAALLVACSAASGNLIVNGSFEEPTGRQIFHIGDTGLTGWTIGGEGGVKVGDFWQAAQGVQAVDLSGTETGTISQSIPTVAGQRYLLTFAMAGNPDGVPVVKTMFFKVGDDDLQMATFDTSGHSDADMGWTYHHYPFIATGDATELIFSSSNTSAFGPVLDDMHVNAVPPGDVNEDLHVNFADLLTLAQNYGSTTATWNTGDVDGDGDGAVGFSDLLTLAQHYGTDASDPPDAATAAVPEPMHVAPAVAVGALALRRRKRPPADSPPGSS